MCVLVVTEVFRLAFAHFCELRIQICAMDSQIPEPFTCDGIISVAQTLHARDRRESAVLLFFIALMRFI